ADLRPRDPLHLLRGQRAADLDQGEVREELDLADVLAVQTALAGQGADDPRGPCTVGVAHPDLVRRVASLGGRCVAARAALSVPVNSSSSEGGPGPSSPTDIAPRAAASYSGSRSCSARNSPISSR